MFYLYVGIGILGILILYLILYNPKVDYFIM